jgi:hypothetical protein
VFVEWHAPAQGVLCKSLVIEDLCIVRGPHDAPHVVADCRSLLENRDFATGSLECDGCRKPRDPGPDEGYAILTLGAVPPI